MKKELEEVHINHFKQKGVLGLYVLLRVSVLVILVLEALRGDWNNVFLCILTLVLFLLPVVLDKTFNIELPTVLEIIVLLFIYSAEILGEIQNFYGIFKSWDTILHTLNGFIMAAIGFSLIDILNNSERFHINLTPIFVALVAFCFSMTIGVLWEFFEYGMDVITRTDMQKDRIVSTISTTMLAEDNDVLAIDDIEKTVINGTINGEKKEIIIENGYLDIGIHDTIKDLIVNCIGAIVFSFIGYLYILGRNNGSFIKQFIPFVKKHRQKNEQEQSSEKTKDKDGKNIEVKDVKEVKKDKTSKKEDKEEKTEVPANDGKDNKKEQEKNKENTSKKVNKTNRNNSNKKKRNKKDNKK